MPREIPELVRAAAGLAATVLDEARKLPEILPGLPVRVIGLAMQRAMQIQQHYAGLVARGDELFTGLRGENEPGLATFDDEEPAAPAPAPGFRDSAFDRAGDSLLTDTTAEDDELDELLADAGLLEETEGDAVVAAAEAVGEQLDEAQQTIEAVATEAPTTDQVLEELAIDDLVAETPTTPPAPAKKAARAKKAAAPAKKAPPAKKATPAKAAPEKAAPEKAAPETVAPEKAAPETVATEKAAPAEATPVTPSAAEPSAEPTTAPPQVTQSLTAPATAPIEGYDSFSIAQLRGHLRGYARKTVEELLAYEEAGLARAPYLRMLRNRLERLRSDANAAAGATGGPENA